MAICPYSFCTVRDTVALPFVFFSWVAVFCLAWVIFISSSFDSSSISFALAWMLFSSRVFCAVSFSFPFAFSFDWIIVSFCVSFSFFSYVAFPSSVFTFVFPSFIWSLTSFTIFSRLFSPTLMISFDLLFPLYTSHLHLLHLKMYLVYGISYYPLLFYLDC